MRVGNFVNSETNYCLRQIRIPIGLYNSIKQYCRHSRKVLREFYKEMLAWFIDSHGKNSALLYQASHKNGRILSLWLERWQVDTIHKMAIDAGVSDARVIYTAMMLYIQHTEQIKGFI